MAIVGSESSSYWLRVETVNCCWKCCYSTFSVLSFCSSSRHCTVLARFDQNLCILVSGMASPCSLGSGVQVPTSCPFLSNAESELAWTSLYWIVIMNYGAFSDRSDLCNKILYWICLESTSRVPRQEPYSRTKIAWGWRSWSGYHWMGSWGLNKYLWSAWRETADGNDMKGSALVTSSQFLQFLWNRRESSFVRDQSIKKSVSNFKYVITSKWWLCFMYETHSSVCIRLLILFYLFPRCVLELYCRS